MSLTVYLLAAVKPVRTSPGFYTGAWIHVEALCCYCSAKHLLAGFSCTGQGKLNTVIHVFHGGLHIVHTDTLCRYCSAKHLLASLHWYMCLMGTFIHQPMPMLYAVTVSLSTYLLASAALVGTSSMLSYTCFMGPSYRCFREPLLMGRRWWYLRPSLEGSKLWEKSWTFHHHIAEKMSISSESLKINNTNNNKQNNVDICLYCSNIEWFSFMNGWVIHT